MNAKNLWIYFPESREAQHVDLAKGIAGKAGTSMESFMPWISFDLAEIEKKYRVTVRTAEVPEGATVRTARPDGKGEPVAAALRGAYRITYTPRDRKKSGGIRRLSIWVDGERPWPLKVEKTTSRGDTVTTEFRDTVLEEKLDPRLFEFTPPRGTKVEELSG